ncbi:hypothetical protein J2746_001403 [Methanolobus bombayensis]|nr:hypothetical protein [Methanolobus bombayensis]
MKNENASQDSGKSIDAVAHICADDIHFTWELSKNRNLNSILIIVINNDMCINKKG